MDEADLRDELVDDMMRRVAVRTAVLVSIMVVGSEEKGEWVGVWRMWLDRGFAFGFWLDDQAKLQSYLWILDFF